MRCVKRHFTSQPFGHVLHEENVNAVAVSEGTALHSAAEGGHVDVAKVLIQNGVDVSAVTEDKCTALHIASKSDVAEVLIQNGAGVNALTNTKTQRLAPFFAAQYDKYVDFLKILVENGADVECCQ